MELIRKKPGLFETRQLTTCFRNGTSVTEVKGKKLKFFFLTCSLGIRHDGYGNECADQTRDIPHVMASTSLKANKRGLSQWSKCSKRMLRNYLRYKDFGLRFLGLVVPKVDSTIHLIVIFSNFLKLFIYWYQPV